MAIMHNLTSVRQLISRQMERVGEGYSMSAMIEIADRCNETCAHCYQVQGEKGELTTEQWKRVLDDLAELGVLVLTISGGEATLRHDFLELVEYAREKQFMVKLYTNGLSMTRELACRLADLAVQEAQISLYSHRAEPHDWVTGVPGSHARTVAGVRHLVEAGVPVMVKSPIMSINVDEITEYRAFADSLGAHYSVDASLKPRENGERDPQGLAATPSQLDRVWREHPDLRELATKEISRPPDSKPCGACRSVHVEANGEVRACTALTVPMGNAVEEGVVASFRHNETAQQVRSITWNDLPGCRVCDLSNDCARCFSDARFEAGDALAPYASACSKAVNRRRIRLGRPVEVRGASSEQSPLGPFRLIAEDCVEPFEYELTEDDLRRRQEQPWTLHEANAAVPNAAQTGLVQIRRPGRKKAIGGSLPLAAKP